MCTLTMYASFSRTRDPATGPLTGPKAQRLTILFFQFSIQGGTSQIIRRSNGCSQRAPPGATGGRCAQVGRRVESQKARDVRPAVTSGSDHARRIFRNPASRDELFASTGTRLCLSVF